jgi:tight adherence protein B
MVLLIVIVFAGVFAVVALLILAGSSTASRQSKQVRATLDSAIMTITKQPQAQAINFRKSELLSAIPWINRLLQKINIVPRLQTLLNQADVKWTVGALLLMCLASFAIPAYLIDLKTQSALFSMLLGAVMGVIPFGFVYLKRSKRFGKFEQGLPDALDLMVSALRVGHSFNAALSLASRECADPIGSELRVCLDEQNYGLDLRLALENMIARMPLQDLRMVVTAILIQRESGGNLAEVLDKTAYVIRQRFRLRKQVMVHTAQGRLTGWILTLLPVLLGIGLYFVNPQTMSLLWKRDIGIKLLCGAGGMLVTGTLIIQKIVHMDV